MVFRQSLGSYARSLTTALGFVLLLIFVLPFFWISNTIVSSGTVLIDYGFLRQPLPYWLALLGLSLVFLFSYSVLVSLMVFAVRNDLSSVKVRLYLKEKIDKFALKYFVFLAAFTIIAAIAASLLVDAGVPMPVVNLALLLLSTSFLFLPQAIVIDEESLFSSILTNWEYILKNPGSFLVVIAFGAVSILGLQVIEFALDYFLFAGNFVSLLVALVFLVPYTEALKTYIYMNRFGIMQSYHKVQ